MWDAESWEGGVKFLYTPCVFCRWVGIYEDTGWDEGSRVVYRYSGHTSTQEGKEFLDGWFVKVVQVLDALVNCDGVQVCVEDIIDQEGDDGHGLEDDIFMVEVWFFKEG